MTGDPVSYCRLYEVQGQGPEHPATPEVVRRVIAAMSEAGDLNPFKVRLRFGDGSVVVVSPKKGPGAK